MSTDEIREHTQGVWDKFYSFKEVWQRSKCVLTLRGRLTTLFVMCANTGISTDSARRQKATSVARILAIPCKRLFSARPMPDLAMPIFKPTGFGKDLINAIQTEVVKPVIEIHQIAAGVPQDTVFEIFHDETAAVNSFFPGREIRGFDILEFVTQFKEGQANEIRKDE